MWLGLLVLLLPGFLHGFKPLLSPDSITHRVISQRAILRKTAEVCRDIALSAGQVFPLTIDDRLTAGAVEKACSPGTSSSFFSTLKFQVASESIYFSNANVDFISALSAKHHFDDETFQEGRAIITAGISSVDKNVQLENFVSGRLALGAIFHTLQVGTKTCNLGLVEGRGSGRASGLHQDFYSHSNWVELGNTAPYSALINSNQPLQNLADINTPTCSNCKGDNCEDNILPELLQRGLLTSGYFNIFSSAKPPGKCSHGGSFDRTSRRDPVGGINKDTVKSSHGLRHRQAADLAVLATMDLLEEIRVIVGDGRFLQLMGLSQSSALCFVIDTTGSMSDDIAEAKRVSLDIIDRKRGTKEEPSAYILVPFNDPDFGPLTRTTSADVFKARINSLTPSGGGDAPEMSLSGLQLALTAAPPSSEIFVFSDAPAKDTYLKSTVQALIETTKSVVNFMITDVTQRASRSLKLSSTMQTYYDLAKASGGQAIQVSKSDLSQATEIIEDSSVSALVTVFQVVQDPGRAGEFTFPVDPSLINVTVYITGFSPLTFNLTSPSGVSQSSDQASGPLASFSTAGNLRRLRLHAGSQRGSWKIQVDSVNSYSVKVTGQSSVNFFFCLVEANEGAHGDFGLKEGRPLSGGNMSLLVTVTGSDTVKVTEVTLADSSGQTVVNGTLQLVDSDVFLVTFPDVLSGEYAVHLKGEDNTTASRSTPNIFQRQASTQIKTSGISLTAQANTTSIEPGASISVPFTVSASAGGSGSCAAETLTVKSTNDRNYASSSPGSVTVAAGCGGAANGTVNLTVPANATSGTDVTLTIEAQNAAGTDINYAVLRFLVSAKVTDVAPPVCYGVTLSPVCPPPDLCASAGWEFMANFTDGVNGTGIRRVVVLQGNGTLRTSSAVGAAGENITVAYYNASCCSASVELAAVDEAGNVERCLGRSSTNTSSSTSTSTSMVTPGVTGVTVLETSTTTVTPAPLSSASRHLSRSHQLWIPFLVFFLWAVK